MPEQHRHVGFCPHCGNTAPQRVALTHRYTTTWYSEDDRPHREGPVCEAIVCICETCDEVLLYDGIEPSEVDSDWPPLVYPQPAELGTEVPKPVREVYLQAARCKEHSPLAFAILIGKALEAICDDRGATKATGKNGHLYHRLQFLADRGDIPPTLAKMTEVLRTLRNAAAHDAPDEITPPVTWAIDDFFRAIIAYVYTAPAKMAKFEKRLERRKRRREKAGD